MGKNNKLRCLFGLSRNRASSPPLNQKFPLTKLSEKHPVTPNEYIQDGRQCVKGMVAKLKTGRIDPDETPEEILPNNEKEQDTIDLHTATNADKTRSKNNAQKLNPVSHTEGKIDASQRCRKGESMNGANSMTMDESPASSHSEINSSRNRSLQSSHSYEKLISPSSSCCSGKESSSSSVPKVYKNPRKKSKPVCENDSSPLPPLNPTCEISSFASSLALGASNAIHDPLLSRTTFPEANGLSFHDQHRVPREPERDCDFGWVFNASKNSEHKRRQSNPNHCSDHHTTTVDQGYVNDNQPNHIPDEEVAFTVTEQNGNSLQFTIAESGIDIQFPQERSSNGFTSDVTTAMTSSCNQRHFEFMHRKQSSPSNTSETRYRRNRHSNLLTMTPSLMPSNNPETTQSLLHEECPKNGDFHNHNGASAISRKSHFKLSMASYSRLMAYCDTNKLNRDSQSISRHRHPKGLSFGQSTTSSSASEAQTQVNDLCRLAKVLETVEECPWYWGAITGQEAKKVLRDAETGTFLLRDSSDPRHLFSLSVKTRQGPTSIRIVYANGSFRFDSEMDDVASRRQGRNGQNNDSSRPDHPNYVKRIAPVFTCVVKMVLHHTTHLGLNNPKPKTHSAPRRDQCQKCSAILSDVSSTDAKNVSTNNEEDPYRPEQFMCYWVNRSGRQEIPVLLSTPILKKQFFPTLQSLCRQSLNKSCKLWAREDTVERFPLPNSLKKYITRYPYPV